MSVASISQRIIRSQRRLSRRFDALLPDYLLQDGNRDFIDVLVPRYLRSGILILDVGGGKQPFLKPERKRELRATVVGLDISADQLAAAPAGAYDSTIGAMDCP